MWWSNFLPNSRLVFKFDCFPSVFDFSPWVRHLSVCLSGLDPASPLFRQMLSASLTSLGADDAKFVDVVHTDGARIWSEGFGLFHPIGDVDYFPNGGLDQPGCEQVRGSVIVSRFGERIININCFFLLFIFRFYQFYNDNTSACRQIDTHTQ